MKVYVGKRMQKEKKIMPGTLRRVHEGISEKRDTISRS